ncbi:chorismate-binding protein [Curtobacterium sp. MCBD17_040]|uniref:anthranilate synthase family protein n=1 Tax=Curtobacterium sp. MCBD17_040 TaxID=2175674 RepID=UPI000DA8511F|nr:chorismate-binding protein [Curtobacterium sp. MCBD17_040]WIB65845.1 chorismate-binding protein [Curtobacterium sp. MCBD17_040]
MTVAVADVMASPQPFALLHRPHLGGHVELLTGPVERPASLSELDEVTAPGWSSLVVVPYRFASERALAAHDDGTDLIVLRVQERARVSVDDISRVRSGTDEPATAGAFDDDDATYAAQVKQIISEEIAVGEGANFVIERRWSGAITPSGHASMLTLFVRLLAAEQSAYWSYLVWTGETYLLGASPERHVQLQDGAVHMSPISGTLRHPHRRPSTSEVLGFLRDEKEDDELCMVLDEELKMMSALSGERVTVSGPTLRQMNNVTHTEYRIGGTTTATAADVLRGTLFAPTVVGSPLRSAAAVIARHEGRGRGYYSGVVALIDGDRNLDSAIIIRTAEVSRAGAVTIGVGATIVRSSDPAAEALETAAKAQSLVGALTHASVTPSSSRPGVDELDEAVMESLTARNNRLAPFWMLGGDAAPSVANPPRVRVINAEDDFTAMLALQLRRLGCTVVVDSWNSAPSNDADLIVLGPGPGDPRDASDPRIAALTKHATTALLQRTPLLAVCLGHQVVAGRLGLPLHRLHTPRQGWQDTIPYFGAAIRVGFYNSFTAVSATNQFRSTIAGGNVDVARDLAGEVLGLRGPLFESFQFHPESILSPDGFAVLRTAVNRLSSAARPHSATRIGAQA